MKKLIFATCLLFTFTSIYAEATVGEKDSECASMIQANRNGKAVIADESTSVRSETEIVTPK